MTWKNIVENFALILVIFVGLGIYTKMVLEPIVVETIRQETTSIEQNIDQKFKKVGQVDAITTPSATSNLNTPCPEIGDCVDISKLSERRKRKVLEWTAEAR